MFNVAFGRKRVVERLRENVLLGADERLGLRFRDAGITKIFNKLVGVESYWAPGVKFTLACALVKACQGLKSPSCEGLFEVSRGHRFCPRYAFFC
ncbi:MAG: hypothetical protein Q7U24_01450, partial [Sulfurimicrobium sp.]|nr:hypothetical protein [Sulfurimicrobium sp.]